MTNTNLLCILDGFGIGNKDKSDAVFMAKMPILNSFLNNYPNTQIKASGEDVGLMSCQMGNSEVGHLNIGAGRVVMQLLPMIKHSIDTNTLKDNKEIEVLIEKVKNTSGSVHLIGLLSDGGVHAHISHIIALCKILSDNSVPVWVHVITDGRDVSPTSAKKFLSQFKTKISNCKNINIATISGRYYAMDRNKNWERTEKFYNAVVNAQSDYKFNSTDKLIDNFYSDKITDEFFIPSVTTDYTGINNGDALLIANFRADRVRQIATAFAADHNFTDFIRNKIIKFSSCTGISQYSEELNKLYSVIFPPENIINSLGEIISKHGMKQLRIAETEKYAHVTFFFNGGKDIQYIGEDRILIPSPDVATFDMLPEMSANEITETLVPEILSQKYSLIVLNFANPDMVGHTGKIPETIKGLEFLDKCIGKIKDAILKINGTMIITADHGNAEKMIDDDGITPWTAHTTNKVPFCIISNNKDLQKNRIQLKPDGKLSDIAPTILQIMNIQIPSEMTGTSLLKKL